MRSTSSQESADLCIVLCLLSLLIASAATCNDDLNVVLNQGYAQAVFHAHFHLIPAPSSHTPPSAPRSSKPSSRSMRTVADWTAAELQRSPPSHREMLRGETDARSGYLSERDGLDISQRIRSFL